jgi:hypothetical protein
MQTSQTYQCDGISTVFACPFPVLRDADLRCYLVDDAGTRPLTLNIDYTVQPGQSMTQVLTTIAHPAGPVLRFERRTEMTDAGDVRQLAFIVQELAADHERAAMVPRGEWLSELPPRDQRARKLAAFDADGDLVALVGMDKASAAWLQLMLADTVFENTGAGMVAYNANLLYEQGSVGDALKELARRLDALGG